MSPSVKNWLLIALLATSAASVWWGMTQHQSVTTLERTVQQGSAAAARLQAQLAEAERRAQKAEAELLALPPAIQVGHVATGSASEPGAPTSDDGLVSGGSTLIDRNLAQFKNPQVSRLLVARAKNSMALRYSGLLGRLHLSPAQNTKLLDLLAERQTLPIDTLSAASENGVTDLRDVGALLSKSQRDLDGEIRSMLGDQGYADLIQYSQQQRVRDTVSELQQSLATTHSPLTGAQYAKMVTLLAAPASPSGTAGSGFVSDAALEQAQSVLTPFQIRTLKAVQNEQRFNLALQVQLAKAGSSTPSPTAAMPRQ